MPNINFKSKGFLILAIIVLILVAGFSYWFYYESSKLYIGQKTDDDGRTHVPIGTTVNYKTNPPTSGSHYEDWIRAGVYPEVKDDRNLVHSLEHGYVIMSYNCSFKETSFSLIKPALAQGASPTEDIPQIETQEASTSSQLSPDFQSADCQKLVQQLADVYNEKGKRKLIVVPRPNLDSKVALTAWARIDKFNTFDKARIEKFIDARRDMGPEKTME